MSRPILVLWYEHEPTQVPNSQADRRSTGCWLCQNLFPSRRNVSASPYTTNLFRIVTSDLLTLSHPLHRLILCVLYSDSQIVVVLRWRCLLSTVANQCETSGAGMTMLCFLGFVSRTCQ